MKKKGESWEKNKKLQKKRGMHCINIVIHSALSVGEQ